MDYLKPHHQQIMTDFYNDKALCFYDDIRDNFALISDIIPIANIDSVIIFSDDVFVLYNIDTETKGQEYLLGSAKIVLIDIFKEIFINLADQNNKKLLAVYFLNDKDTYCCIARP